MMPVQLNREVTSVSYRLTFSVLALLIGPTGSITQSRADAASDLIRSYMAEHHIAGIAVAIGERGEVVYSAALGFADLEAGEPVTEETLFRTASVLKPMTATAVLQLATAGALNLNESIQSYCPAYPTKQWLVTASQLIVHEGGVRPSVFADIFNRDHYPTVSAAISRFADDTLVAEPGTKAVYSNAGYTLLACAIEGVTGTTYDAYMREHIFVPARMTHTRLDNVFEVIPGRARPYMVRTEDNTEQWRGLWQPRHLASATVGVPFNADPVDPSWAPGAGGYLTTPVDLAHFAIALMDGDLLPPDTLAHIPGSHTLPTGETSGRSHGWVVEETNGGTVIKVFGSDWNGSSGLWVLPAHGFAIAISTNKAFEQPSPLAEDLARLWGRLPPG